MPRNAAKRFPKLGFREASDLAKEKGSIELISAANANAHLANFSSFLNWAVTEELLARNPMRGLRLPDEVSKRDKRHPFSAKQLEAIFNAPLYGGCLDGGRGYAKPGSERPRNARFWVPLIALHTGMRLNEICQLDTSDIREVEGIHCIVVSEKSRDGAGDKALKTLASERLIPIHPQLTSCGLLAFVRECRHSARIKLFEEIDPGPRGKRAIAFSKWFTQFTRACGAYQPRTSFHSFRHNFRDELRDARIDHDIAMELGGWTMGGGSRGVSDNYGSGHKVSAIHDAICRLRFTNVEYHRDYLSIYDPCANAVILCTPEGSHTFQNPTDKTMDKKPLFDGSLVGGKVKSSAVAAWRLGRNPHINSKHWASHPWLALPK